MQHNTSYRRSRNPHRAQTTYHRHLSTKTVLGLFLGVFIAYSSYFILNASGDDQPRAQTVSSEYNIEEALPLTTAQAATADLKGPADRRAIPPVKEPLNETQKTQTAPSQKKGIFGKFREAFKKDNASKEDEKPSSPVTKEVNQEQTTESITTLPSSKEANQNIESAGHTAEEIDQDPVKEVFNRDTVTTPESNTSEIGNSDFVASQIAHSEHTISQKLPYGPNAYIVTSKPSPQDTTCRTLRFDASKSYDPDNDQLNFQWDFGDGKPKSNEVRVRHTFPMAGEYKVTLHVTDNSTADCDTAISYKTVSVNTAPIAIGVFPKTLRVDQTGIFDARRSKDTPGDRLNFYWNFGDGTSTNEPVASHRFTKPGEHQVILTVKDNSNTVCDTNIVMSTVIVEGTPAEAPKLALKEPESVKPRLRDFIPEEKQPELFPARQVDHEWEIRNYIDRLDKQRRMAESELEDSLPEQDQADAEMEGLLVQIRAHQGEEEPAPKPVVAEKITPKVRVAERIERRVPVFLAVDTPKPERKQVKQTVIAEPHRYVLAWAGGYLVNCPTVNCGTETDASFSSRLGRRLDHLIEFVNTDRDSIKNVLKDLHNTSSEQKSKLIKQDQNLERLQNNLLQFKEESNQYQRSQFAQVSGDLLRLTDQVEETHDEVLAIAVRNASTLRNLGEQVTYHTRDDTRHKTQFESQQTPFTFASPQQERSVPQLPAAPEESE